jgi:homeobox protein cut-like
MRTGTETASRVKDLETQVSELELEADRLSSALNAQKNMMVELEVTAGKKAEDVSKEIQNKVGCFCFCLAVRLENDSLGCGFITQAVEIEQLKLRLKQYGDYDEIKRELEIMKACKVPFHVGSDS